MKITPVKQWRRQKNVSTLIGKIGQILEWTMIYTTSSEFIHSAPYPVVIVKMKDNQKMIGQLVDFDQKDLKSGKKVEAVLRRASTTDKEGIVHYTIKFKPLL